MSGRHAQLVNIIGYVADVRDIGWAYGDHESLSSLQQIVNMSLRVCNSLVVAAYRRP